MVFYISSLTEER